MQILRKHALKLVAFVVVMLVIATPALATVSNGGFETGDFTGWSTYAAGDGGWAVVTSVASSPFTCAGAVGFTPTPTEGSYMALGDMYGPNTAAIWQNLSVTGPQPTLLLDYAYNNAAGVWSWTGVLDHTSGSNQHFRIDIMDPAAGNLSMAGSDILATVLATGAGSPFVVGPTTLSYDLSPWSGQTVRLRIAKVDNLGCFPAMIDNVRIVEGVSDAYQKIGQVQVNAPGTALYEEPGGNPVRDAAGNEIWVPNQTAPDPSQDVYDVISQVEFDGQTWVNIFVGNSNRPVWVPVGGPVQVLSLAQ